MRKILPALLSAGCLLATAAVCHANGVAQPIKVQSAARQVSDRAVTLGAGDQLGKACYTRYVVVVRAEQQRSVVETLAPAPKPKPATPLIARADFTHHNA